ncbi:hypothetical protein QZH56_13720 [Streptomyces olivoreticuli]|uniref:hypothetical protein n=1 Tax=Streptomyces olivoreticuli TaxID=68246 RepID=UPI002659723C|nr:hypothetical protein [Streptomyces olivoreticuli]WKK26551.1 hypothetical protein QZH56_13720 [Streptomyces olivoreticuli]
MSRSTRAADRELGRTRRRASLAVLLARADRLLPAEADQLRAMVDAEITDGDRARRTAGGYTAAVRRLHARIEAAETAIVEAEQRTAVAEQALSERGHLALAPVQTCRACGAGYDLGQQCSTCAYRAAAAGQAPARHPGLDRLLDHVAAHLDAEAQQ